MRDQVAARESFASSLHGTLQLPYGGNQVTIRPRADEVMVRVRCLKCQRVLAHACGSAANGMRALGSHHGDDLRDLLTGTAHVRDLKTHEEDEAIENASIVY